MGNYVYDNGEKILGNVKDIAQYIKNGCEDYEEMEEILSDLREFDNNTMIVLDYANGMGFTIEYWTEKDKSEIDI